MDFKVVDKPKNFPEHRGRISIFKPIFDSLPFNKCLMFKGNLTELRHKANKVREGYGRNKGKKV